MDRQRLIKAPMPILTPRLQLCPRRRGEGSLIAAAVEKSMTHLQPWMNFAREIPSADQMEEHCQKAIEEFAARSNFTLSIYDREGKTFLGSTGLHRPNWDIPSFHIGYWLCREFEGQGFVTEAVNALTRYAVEVFKSRRIEIRCDSRNFRSLAVMTRLGFVHEGTLKNEALAPDGSLRDTIVTARYDLEGLPPLAVEWDALT